jgi:hypothetical protein
MAAVVHHVIENHLKEVIISDDKTERDHDSERGARILRWRNPPKDETGGGLAGMLTLNDVTAKAKDRR